MENLLPPIPAKRYFTIGEVGDLCGVKPHVLRYWEQEFTQLRPMKRRGNRRYYQHHEVLMIRRIRELLYDQGFTISGARNKLQELHPAERNGVGHMPDPHEDQSAEGSFESQPNGGSEPIQFSSGATAVPLWSGVRRELLEIRELLGSSV